MKLLRILTGTHAGAQVPLAPGDYRIGADDDADVRISDWTGPDVRLTVGASGLVSAHRAAHAGSAATVDGSAAASDGATQASDTGSPLRASGTVLMLDFVPIQFDDAVLCIGEEDATWPTDLELLSTLLVKPGERLREAQAASASELRGRRRRVTRMIIGGIAVGVIGASASLVLATNGKHIPRASSTTTAEVEQLNAALKAAHLDELYAVRGEPPRGDTDISAPIEVRGMVPGASEDYMARRIFEREVPQGVDRRYAVGENVAHSIEDALQIDGVRVRYEGHGAFALTGHVASTAMVASRLAGVRRDLDKSVRTVDLRVTQSDTAPPPDLPASYSSVVDADGIQYAQTPDGTKHIVMVDEPATDASASTTGTVSTDADVRAASGPVSTAVASVMVDAQKGATRGAHDGGATQAAGVTKELVSQNNLRYGTNETPRFIPPPRH